MKILNTETREIIFELDEVVDIKELVEEATYVDANLRGADLRGANLRGANLRGADLIGVDLRDANLRVANLRGANLIGVDLRDANLRGANLRGANLMWANLEGAISPDFLITPSEGSFIAFKRLSFGVIIKIKILKDSKRTNSLVGRKCRTDKFKVISVVENPNNVEISKERPLSSTHYKSIGYYVGGVFEEPEYDDDIRQECTKGLHFFMTLKEAQEWC